jgi:hypothetical protein
MSMFLSRIPVSKLYYQTLQIPLRGFSQAKTLKKFPRVIGLTPSPQPELNKEILEEFKNQKIKVIYIGKEKEVQNVFRQVFFDPEKPLSNDEERRLAEEVRSNRVEVLLHLSNYLGNDKKKSSQVNVEGTLALARARDLAANEGKNIPMVVTTTALATLSQGAQSSGMRLKHQVFADNQAFLQKRLDCTHKNITTLCLDSLLPHEQFNTKVAPKSFLQMRVGNGEMPMAPISVRQAAQGIRALSQELREDPQNVPSWVYFGGDLTTRAELAKSQSAHVKVSLTLDPHTLFSLTPFFRQEDFSTDYLELVRDVPESVVERAKSKLDTTFHRSLEEKYAIKHVSTFEKVQKGKDALDFKKAISAIPASKWPSLALASLKILLRSNYSFNSHFKPHEPIRQEEYEDVSPK